MMSTGGTVLPLRLIVATSFLQSICRELVECAQVAVIPSPRIMHHQFKQVSTPCKSKKIPAHAAPLGSWNLRETVPFRSRATSRNLKSLLLAIISPTASESAVS
ncbi:hypothetical protein B0H14DRAFT_1178238 [Mycena olivaceomarginata]|nr:hypothetical protein B0H14DRAFT_1178238 [Mycena olivaceomarginata]